jgi:hypothetical protein
MATVVEALIQEGWTDAMQALQAWPDDQVAALARRLPVDTLRRLLVASTRSAAPAAPAAGMPPDMAQPSGEVSRFDTPSCQVAQRLARYTALPEPAAAWLAALWLAPMSGDLPGVAQVQVVLELSRQVDEASPGVAPTRAATEAPTGRGLPRDGRRQEPRVSATTSLAEPPVDGTDAGRTPSARPPSEVQRSPAWRMESGLVAPRRSAPAPQRHSRAGPSFAGTPWPWLDDADETAHGGLLLFVNLLQALRFERWLGAQPPPTRQPFVDALFTHVLSHCGAPAHDPQFAWFAPTPAAVEVLASASFDDAGRQLDTAIALCTWRLRLRRALRRHVGLDMPELVSRSAWVSGSATHLDVVFPLAEVELRLRRRGLDSDPGWVAWFGRIVAFHFVEVDALPQRRAGEGIGGG